MLTHLADIFRTPLSQSSARRANVNVFFPDLFFTRTTDFAEKQGLLLCYILIQHLI